MPRAVLISVGELSLEPIKTLVESNGVTTATIVVSDTASLKNLDALTSKLTEQHQNAECLLVHASNGVEKSVLGFTGIATHLIFSAPETYLTQRLVASQSTENTDTTSQALTQQFTQQYSEYVQNALNAHEQNSALRLCSIDDILANPAVFIKTVFEKDSQEVKSELTTNLVYQTMALSAAAALVDNDELFELYDDALSVGQLFGEFSVHISPDSDTFKHKSTVLREVALAIQQKNHQMTALNKKASEQATENAAKIAEKDNALATANEQLSAKQQKCAALQQSLEVRANELDATKRELAATTSELGAKAKDLEAKTTKLSEKEAQCNQLTQQLAEHKTTAEQQQKAVNAELEKQKQALATANEQLSAKQQECAALQQSLEASANELDATTKELAATASELGAKVKDLEAKTTKLSEKEAQCNQLTQQLAEHKTTAEQQQKAVNAELEKQKQAVTTASEQLSVKQQECAALQQSLEARAKELDATTKELAATTSELNARAKDLEAKTTKLSEKEAQCNQLTQQFAEQKQTEELTQLQVMQLQEELEAISQEASRLVQAEIALKASNENALQLQQKLSVAQEELQLSALQITQLQEELEAISQEASRLVQAEIALKASNENALQLQQKLSVAQEELQLSALQITQLQEELEATSQKASRLEQAEIALKASNENALQLQQKLNVAQEELQLSALQITLLQEELEATSQKARRLEQAEIALKASNENALQLQQKLSTAQEEAEFATLQISQLQEELEHVFTQCEALKAKESEAASLSDKYSQQQTAVETLSTENALLTKQISQLQQGLEKAELEKEALTQAHNELQQTQTAHDAATATSNEKLHNAELELELASLQISQLQEELEYYYNAWQEAQQNGTQVIKMGKHHQKVFGKAQAESLVITGKYSEDGYQDAHFMLNNVLLGDGRHFAELAVKLVRIGEYIAIEFRDSSDGSLFQHFEDSVDEYGPFLRFFVQPPESHLEQQQVTFSRMNTSDRVLLMSVINLLAEHIQDSNINCETVLTSSDWRTWRISAIKLAELIDDMPIWLSFDSVILKEEYQTEGYEHLWLSFHNMLVGDSWKEILELKVAATGINSGTATFCDAISLEFREQEDGTVPLFTWPPETVDEHGPKFTVSLSDLDNLSEVARADRLLILHLATNLPEIIYKIAENAELVSRHKDEWAYAAKFLLAGPKEVSNSDNHEVYSLKEAISMGSYQHLLFSSYDNSTDVKLKAENINPDTFDAEVYLEFRNGNEKVIGNSTEFYGEDEFGPRVVIPLEVLLIELHSKSSTELDWAIQYFINIENKLTTLQNLDELIKRLWTNLLTRKKEIVDN
ncbi:hypothetical protein [Alteromonas sp. OM2203]|uniref:hypothetical protein n=1 Tax=Alteromonas sp. OM2203 TaxID=3398817 RepID=UPI003AF388A2